MSKTRFSFNKDFQFDILRFIAIDKNGYKAIELLKSSYFSLLEHRIIAQTFIGHFKKKRRLPKSLSLFKELLNKEVNKKIWVENLNDENVSRLEKLTKKLYKGYLPDSEDILEEIVKFSQFVEFSNVLEKADPSNYDSYDFFQDKIQNIFRIGRTTKDDYGIFLISDIKQRQTLRKTLDSVVKTPYWQLNRLTNAGGYAKGSLIVFMGKEKDFKTGSLINYAKALLRKRRKVLYVDLENSQDNLAIRAEQSFMNLTKKDILRGEYDDKINKKFRRYKRIGSEMIIKRFSAYKTNANTIRHFIKMIYLEYGLSFTDVVVDYAALLGSLSKKNDDTERISDVYVDLKNLAEELELNSLITANHVTRQGEVRLPTKFISNDLAKCKDIGRHVDALIGISHNEDEDNANVLRWEIIEQRDGKPSGSVYHWVNKDTQSLKEFSKAQLKEFITQLKQARDESKDL